jgi:elongation factor P--(R)-beta-lysine ligase
MTRQAWWHPERFAARRNNLLTRAAIATALRTVFADQGFIEVETPALQVSGGMEPHLDVFATELRAPGTRTGARRYLHTSPEFAMKKLLVAGMDRIFQFAHVFRNAEHSATHHPEFTMLEWYRARPQLDALVDDCGAVLRAAAISADRGEFTWCGRSCDPRQPIERLSVTEAFASRTGIDILATAPEPRGPSLDLLAEAAKPLGIVPHPGDSWEDLFFRIFLDHIEPTLGIEQPTVLYDYPVAMAALARPKPEDPRVAERFELYVCGLELANAFGELTDADEQRRRFLADRELKQRRYGVSSTIDEDFLVALAHGMPPSAGIALGFDRLVMLATGAENIEDVLWAPVAPPEST